MEPGKACLYSIPILACLILPVIIIESSLNRVSAACGDESYALLPPSGGTAVLPAPDTPVIYDENVKTERDI
jgi:hypothetical protein